jgi:uncharacterized membrane protein
MLLVAFEGGLHGQKRWIEQKLNQKQKKSQQEAGTPCPLGQEWNAQIMSLNAQRGMGWGSISLFETS